MPQTYFGVNPIRHPMELSAHRIRQLGEIKIH